MRLRRKATLHCPSRPIQLYFAATPCEVTRRKGESANTGIATSSFQATQWVAQPSATFSFGGSWEQAMNKVGQGVVAAWVQPGISAMKCNQTAPALPARRNCASSAPPLNVGSLLADRYWLGAFGPMNSRRFVGENGENEAHRFTHTVAVAYPVTAHRYPCACNENRCA